MGAAGTSRSLRWGAGIVVALAAVALAAPLLAPYPPNQQLDPVAAAGRPPGTVLALVELRDGRTYLADRVERTAEGLVIERRGRLRTLAADEVANLAPGGVADRRVFLLGTDRFSRDLLSRLLYGARVSLSLGLTAVALAVGLGIGVGALAALGGPLVDGVTMRLVDALMAFPRLFLLVALAALFQPGNLLLVAVLGGTAWMSTSRLVRAELLGLATRPFVLAARGLGLPGQRVFARHLLPNALTPVLVVAALMVGDVILAESALSFLGLGIQPPEASWGTIIADGRDTLFSQWWISALPGLAIVVAVVGFNLLGDGLRDLLDPRTGDGAGERTAAPPRP